MNSVDQYTTPGGTSAVGDDYARFSDIAGTLSEMGYDTVPPPPLKSFEAKREEVRKERRKKLVQRYETNEDTSRGL